MSGKVSFYRKGNSSFALYALTSRRFPPVIDAYDSSNRRLSVLLLEDGDPVLLEDGSTFIKLE